MHPEGDKHGAEGSPSPHIASSGRLSTVACNKLGASLATKFNEYATLSFNPLTEQQCLIDLTSYSADEQRAIVAGMVEKISEDAARAHEFYRDSEYGKQHFSAVLALYLAGGDISDEFLRAALVDSKRNKNHDPLSNNERMDLRLLRWAEQIDGSPVYSNHQVFEKLMRDAQEQQYPDRSPQARWQVPALILTNHGGERTGSELRALGLGKALIEKELERLPADQVAVRSNELWPLARAASARADRMIECAGVCQGVEKDSAISEKLACFDNILSDRSRANWIKTLYIASRSDQVLPPSERAKFLAAMIPEPEELVTIARQTLTYSYAGSAHLDAEREVIRTQLGLALLNEARDKASSTDAPLTDQRYTSLRREIVGCLPLYRHLKPAQELEELRKGFFAHAIIAEDTTEAFQSALQAMAKDMLSDRLSENPSRFPEQNLTKCIAQAWPDLAAVPDTVRSDYERYVDRELTADKVKTLHGMFADKATKVQAERWGRVLLAQGEFEEGRKLLVRYGVTLTPAIVKEAALVMIAHNGSWNQEGVRRTIEQAYSLGADRITVPEILGAMQQRQAGFGNDNRGEVVAPLLDLLDVNSLLQPVPGKPEETCVKALKEELVVSIDAAIHKERAGGSREFWDHRKVRSLFQLIKAETQVKEADPVAARKELYAEYVATLRGLIRENYLHESVVNVFLEGDTNLNPKDPSERSRNGAETEVAEPPIDRRLLKHPIIELALNNAVDGNSVHYTLESIAKIEKKHIARVAPELSATLVEDALLLRNAGYMAKIALARGKRTDYEPYPRSTEAQQREAAYIVHTAQEDIEKSIYPRKATVKVSQPRFMGDTRSEEAPFTFPLDPLYFQQVQNLVSSLPSCDQAPLSSLEPISELALLQLQGIVTSDSNLDAKPRPWEGWQTLSHLSFELRSSSVEALGDCFERSIDSKRLGDAYWALATAPGGPTDAQRERLARILLREISPGTRDFWQAAELLSTRGTDKSPRMYTPPPAEKSADLYSFLIRKTPPQQEGIELPAAEILSAVAEKVEAGKYDEVVKFDKAIRAAYVTVDGKPIGLTRAVYVGMLPGLASKEQWDDLRELQKIYPDMQVEIAAEVAAHYTQRTFPSQSWELDKVIELAPTLRGDPRYKATVLTMRNPEEVFKRLPATSLTNREYFDLIFAPDYREIVKPDHYSYTPWKKEYLSYPNRILSNQEFLAELLAKGDQSELRRVAWTAAILNYPLQDNPALQQIVTDSKALADTICQGLIQGIENMPGYEKERRQTILTQAIGVANYFSNSELAERYAEALRLSSPEAPPAGSKYA